MNEPARGFYREPVAVLDWKSLYPSVMISHNLCPSTWVQFWDGASDDEGYTTHAVDSGFVTRFATKDRHKGILPSILESLLEERSKAKKEVKKHKKLALSSDDNTERERSEALAKVFDGRQLALKVACNSVYGACGAIESGKYPCLAVSATTTFEGREAMAIKRNILPERFPGVRIIYGDSVSETTPLLVRRSGVVMVCTPLELWCMESPTGVRMHADDKEALHVPGQTLESWTDEGWTIVTIIVRHRTTKDMFRVETRTGIVEVTEDHALLREDGSECRATDVISNETKLLHSLPSSRVDSTMSEEMSMLARILGLFLTSGSSCRSDKVYDWAIRSPDWSLLERYKTYCEHVFKRPFRIIRMCSGTNGSARCKLVIVADGTDLVDWFLCACFTKDGRHKRIPTFVLNASENVMLAYFQGIADGRTVHTPSNESIVLESECVALGLVVLLRTLRYHFRLKVSASKKYHIRYSSRPLTKRPNTVRK